MNVSELVTTASPIINKLGSAFYFAPATLARGKERGLNGWQLYVLGRGGPLGDVEPAVVHSAFGYFNIANIEKAWNGGRAVVPPREAGRLYMECAAEHGRAKLSGVDGLAELVADADAIDAAADPVGFTLYAAVSAEPRADDVPGRAMQLIAILRELRGSAHLVALRATGVDSKTAHFVKRPKDIGIFGWTEEDAPEITDATHAAMAEAEALTDRLVTPAYAAVDESRRQQFVDTLRRVDEALSAG